METKEVLLDVPAIYTKVWNYILSSDIEFSNIEFPKAFPPTLLINDQNTKNTKYFKVGCTDVTFVTFNNTNIQLIPYTVTISLFTEAFKKIIQKEFGMCVSIAIINMILLHTFIHEFCHYGTHCAYYGRCFSDKYNSDEALQEFIDYEIRLNDAADSSIINRNKYRKTVKEDERNVEYAALILLYNLFKNLFENQDDLSNSEKDVIDMILYYHYDFHNMNNEWISELPIVNEPIEDIIDRITKRNQHDDILLKLLFSYNGEVY